MGVGGEVGGGVGASGRERAGEAGGEKQMVAARGGGGPNPNPNPSPDLDELRRQPATCHGGRHHGRLAHEAEARAPGRASVGEYTRALAIPLPVLGRGGPGGEGRQGAGRDAVAVACTHTACVGAAWMSGGAHSMNVPIAGPAASSRKYSSVTPPCRPALGGGGANATRP